MDLCSSVYRGSWRAKQWKAEICNIMCFIKAWLQEHSKIPTPPWDLRWRRHKKTSAVCSSIKVWQCSLTTDGVIMSLLLSKTLSARNIDHFVVSLHQRCLPRVQLQCAHAVIYQPRIKARQTHFSVFVGVESAPLYFKLSKIFFLMQLHYLKTRWKIYFWYL